MISKAKIKQIRSLEIKKYRQLEGLFVAEGPKVIEELCKVCEPVEVYEGEDATKASFLQHPQGTLALFKTDIFDKIIPQSKLKLMLDGIQDPGNLGTIIRIADWFGIRNIFCSLHCADVYGTKTVQATMGALARVRVHYVDLETFFSQLPQHFPVYGTFMDGKNIYSETLTAHGIILMGNEGNGISEKAGKLVTNRLLIPNFPQGEPTSESLNVGVATAIICAEFRRRI